MQFVDAAGNAVLSELSGTGTGPVGALGIYPGPPAPGSGKFPAMAPLEMGEPQTPPHREQGWVRATELQSAAMEGDVWVGTVATTDPAWTLEVRARAAQEGVIAVTVRAHGGAEGGDVQASSIAFAASEGERFVRLRRARQCR